MGPGIKKNYSAGFAASAYDIAPTILHLYGIELPPQKQAARLNR